MPEPAAPVPPTPLELSVPPQRRRKLRWLKWVFAVLLVGLVSIVGWKLLYRELVRMAGKRELAATVAEADRTDPNWRWEPLNATRKKPPAGQNAAEFIPQIQARSRPEWGKQLSSLDARINIPHNVRFSPSVIAQARRELMDVPDAVLLARAMHDRPFGHRDVVLPVNYHSLNLDYLNHTRDCAALLRWDVVIAVEDNAMPLAVNNLRALLNTSRSIGDEPLLLSQFTRMGLRSTMVQSTEWLLAQRIDAQQLAELQETLAADTEEPLLLNGLRGERAALDQLFENLQTGIATRDSFKPELGTDSLSDQFAWWHYRGWLPADRAYALQHMTRCVEAAKLPIHQQPARIRAIRRPAPEPSRVLSYLLLDGIQNASEAFWRTTAEARCAVVGIACERFRQKHNRWPTELVELAPEFLMAVPLDPYDGQPLRYVKVTHGVVVYSVGKRWNVLAEYGINKPNEPIPKMPPGVEIGFRLWNPDQRRLPARPDPVERMP